MAAGEVATNTISDAGGNVFIQLDETDINFASTTLTWNGQPIGGGEEFLLVEGGGLDLTTGDPTDYNSDYDKMSFYDKGTTAVYDYRNTV